jgi:hypothetical protein
MKKMVVTGITALFLAIGLPAISQEDTAKKSTPSKVTNGVKKGAKKAWKGTKKGAKNGKAKVTDKKSSEWVGPNGQDIYVDDGNKYYWINEKGGREFVSKDQLKAKQQ